MPPKKFDPRRKSFFSSSSPVSSDRSRPRRGEAETQREREGQLPAPKAHSKQSSKSSTQSLHSSSSRSSSRRVSTTRSPAGPAAAVFHHSPQQNAQTTTSHPTAQPQSQPQLAASRNKRKASAAGAASSVGSSKPGKKAKSAALLAYPAPDPAAALPHFDYSAPFELALCSFFIENVNQELVNCRSHFVEPQQQADTEASTQYLLDAIERVLGGFVVDLLDHYSFASLKSRYDSSPASFHDRHTMKPNSENQENTLKLKILDELMTKIGKQEKEWSQLEPAAVLEGIRKDKKDSGSDSDPLLASSSAGKLNGAIASAFASASLGLDSLVNKLKSVHQVFDTVKQFRSEVSEAVNAASIKPYEGVGGLADSKKLIQNMIAGSGSSNEGKRGKN